MNEQKILTSEAIEQVQGAVEELLCPYVTELMEQPRFTSEIEPVTPAYGGGIKTLFLHETQNITPDVDIFKLDLSVTPGELHSTSVKLTVLERESSDKRYNRSVLSFTLLKEGSLQFEKLESEIEERDPISFLEDVKASLKALPTVSFGKI